MFKIYAYLRSISNYNSERYLFLIHLLIIKSMSTPKYGKIFVVIVTVKIKGAKKLYHLLVKTVEWRPLPKPSCGSKVTKRDELMNEQINTKTKIHWLSVCVEWKPTCLANLTTIVAPMLFIVPSKIPMNLFSSMPPSKYLNS